MRHIPLQGASNFRDFGGYTGIDGRQVKQGLLYRSDRLNGLTPADFEALSPRGIRVICDLRRTREIVLSPTTWPGQVGPGHAGPVHAGPEALHVSLLTDEAGPDVMSRILADPAIRSDPARSRLEMITLYRQLAQQDLAIAGYKTIFERLAQDDALPFLVHCSAGKDRTGVVCALIQSVLGVSKTDIRDDFMLTAKHYDGAKNAHARVPQIMAGLDVEGWTVEALAPVFTVEEAYLDGFLDAVEAEHGTIAAFLSGPVGLSAETLNAVRAQLLENA